MYEERKEYTMGMKEGSMNTNTGVACECSKCNEPQWYEYGVCKGCNSYQNIKYTWIASSKKNEIPCAAPNNEMHLESGASAKLVDVWTNLLLVRGLTPYLTSDSHVVVQYSSADWYKARGINFTVQCTVPIDSEFSKKLNKASAWTNESFLVRIMVTFEAFLSGGKKNSKFRLPNAPGMREYHHARHLRNNIAHGGAITNQRLVNEAKQLFGPKAVVKGSCNLDISLVLEPLWARLLLYARFLEDGVVVPPNNPAVVVAADNANLTVQTFDGIQQFHNVVGRCVGEVISLSDIA